MSLIRRGNNRDGVGEQLELAMAFGFIELGQFARCSIKRGEGFFAHEQGAEGGEGSGAPGGGQQAGKGNEGDVVDAEFEEVKDKK